MARVKKSAAPPAPQEDPAVVARRLSGEYLFAKAEADRWSKKAASLRTAMFTALDAVGDKDPDGHVRYRFDTPIDGFFGLVKQRRVSRVLDTEAAERICTTHEIDPWREVVTTVLDEEKILSALQEGVLSEAEIDEIWKPSTSYALVAEKK